MQQSTAIMVLNYNGKPHLDVCLSSVLSQVGPDDHVYLVDNGSTDGSIEYVTQRFPQVKVIRFETNLGFAPAYNRAVDLVSEEILLFLNNDVEVERDWLASLKLALQASPRETICGSKILLYDNRTIINHAGGLLTITGAGIDLNFMRKEVRGTEVPREVGCVSGAAMMMARKLFLGLAGFDEGFFAYFEDVDLCWRAWLEGYRVLSVPSSRVYHKLSSTSGPRLIPERVFLGEKNRLQTMFKNLEFRNLLLAIFVSSLYNITRIVHLLRLKRARTALAVLRADLWFMRHFTRIIKKRRQIQRARKVSDHFLVEQGLMMRLNDAVREFNRLTRLSSA
jgi:GT2 family glycosyltransferase